MLYAEVQLHRSGKVIAGHGDRDKSVVFYVDIMKAGARKPGLRRRDANRLVIDYDSRSGIYGGAGQTGHCFARRRHRIPCESACGASIASILNAGANGTIRAVAAWSVSLVEPNVPMCVQR